MRAGSYVFEANARPLDGGDIDEISDTKGAIVAVADRPRVLYAGSAPAGVQRPLARAGFDVTVQDAGSLPRSPSFFAAYDVVILDEEREQLLAPARRAALASYVEQQGGGLFVLGGPDSLEAGRLEDDPIGDLLPIDFRPRSGQRAASLALVIAFDKSGSMDDRVGGVPRLEFARQAVRRIFDAVPSSDAVGVIAFDAAAHEVAPLRARAPSSQLRPSFKRPLRSQNQWRAPASRCSVASSSGSDRLHASAARRLSCSLSNRVCHSRRAALRSRPSASSAIAR